MNDMNKRGQIAKFITFIAVLLIVIILIALFLVGSAFLAKTKESKGISSSYALTDRGVLFKSFEIKNEKVLLADVYFKLNGVAEKFKTVKDGSEESREINLLYEKGMSDAIIASFKEYAKEDFPGKTVCLILWRGNKESITESLWASYATGGAERVMKIERKPFYIAFKEGKGKDLTNLHSPLLLLYKNKLSQIELSKTFGGDFLSYYYGECLDKEDIN